MFDQAFGIRKGRCECDCLGQVIRIFHRDSETFAEQEELGRPISTAHWFASYL
jgi:hypothetical protein